MFNFTTRPEITGNFGVVTSTHWIASTVGMSILEKGGNAFDAAVATGFTLQVVEPHLNAPGETKHVGKIKRLSFGPRYKGNEAITNDFYQLCRKADFQTILSEDINQDIWEKWIFLATIAGATTLFQTSIDNINTKPNGKIFIQNLWNECINISKENGYELRTESKSLHEDLLFKSGYPFKASMLVDMEKKLMTEHEHIFFEFIKLGKKKKLNTSLLETCHLNMSIYEDNLNKEG